MKINLVKELLTDSYGQYETIIDNVIQLMMLLRQRIMTKNCINYQYILDKLGNT